jgi:hypothetical protein
MEFGHIESSVKHCSNESVCWTFGFLNNNVVVEFDVLGQTGAPLLKLTVHFCDKCGVMEEYVLRCNISFIIIL